VAFKLNYLYKQEGDCLLWRFYLCISDVFKVPRLRTRAETMYLLLQKPILVCRFCDHHFSVH